MHPSERMKSSSVLIQTISTDALSNGKSKAQSSVERYGCGVKIHIYICWDGNEKSHWKDTEEAGQLPAQWRGLAKIYFTLRSLYLTWILYPTK